MLYLNSFPDEWPTTLACDLETTGLDPFTNKILAVALSDGQDTWIITHVSPLFTRLDDLFKRDDIKFIFFNAKFDMKFIRVRWGAMVARLYDGLLAEQVLTAGQNMPNSLDQVLARYFGVLLEKEVRNSFIDHPGFIQKPITSEQLKYMQEDVFYLLKLEKEQADRLVRDQLVAAAKCEFDLVPAMVTMELGGIRLDRDKWFTFLAEFEERKAQSLEMLYKLLGEEYSITVDAKEKKQPIKRVIPVEKINLSSPIQLLAILKDLGADIENTQESTLQDLLDYATGWRLTSFVKSLLDYRMWVKRIGFGYEKYVNVETGKVHPNFHQLGARTGRQSCSDPNMQQVPRPAPGELNFRTIWTADTSDYRLVKADYSQQEARVMADLSGDREMQKACSTDDVYLGAAESMYGRKIEKGSEERQIMKTFFLATGYGAGVERLHVASGLPMEECERIRNEIRQAFPVMARFGKVMDKQLQTYGFVTTKLGRRRYFPIKSERTFAAAVNTPVQGTAADMLKLSMARVHNYLTDAIKCGKIDSNSRIILAVHDELVVHCHKDDVEMVMAEVCRIMEDVGKELCPSVRHIAEAKYGYTWGD